MTKLPSELIIRYSDAVAVHGPGSPEAEEVRRENANNPVFLAFAKTIDRVKRAVVRGKTNRSETAMALRVSPKSE
jgi:hypothetical protein